MQNIIDILKTHLNEYPYITHILKIAGILLLSWVVYIFARKYLLRWLEAAIHSTKITLDDALFRNRVFHRLALIAPAIIIYNFAYLFGDAGSFIRRVVTALIVLIAMLVIGALLSTLRDVLSAKDHEKRYQVKSSIQIARIVLYVVGSVVVIAALVGQSPFVLLSGIGALTAVFVLVFRDTILSFIAGIQISSYDLVKVGDWIEVPKYGADGDVIDIALHTVKVQNWDKTITMIPTHKLIEESFKNWRGMEQSGGRRIKRAINIDMTSVRFCDDDLLARFDKMLLIKDYIHKKQKEIEIYNAKHNIDTRERINGRWMTNLGVFRAYLQAYLRNHPKIHSNLTFLIRQLPLGPYGLPIEIYVFTNDTEWGNYEAIQADIFDHIIAAMSWFDLRIYQHPSGNDLVSMRGKFESAKV